MQVNIVIMVSLQQKSTDVDRHAITAQQQKLQIFVRLELQLLSFTTNLQQKVSNTYQIIVTMN